MSPPVEEWPAHQLPFRVYAQPDGRRRKAKDAATGPGGEIDLTKCPLYELMQYACEPEPDPRNPGKTLIKCKQIVRTFRKCKAFTAEVTALPDLQKP